MQVVKDLLRSRSVGVMLSRTRRFAFRASVVGLVAVAAGAPRSAEAVTVDVFLISSQTAPTSSTAPLSFTTTNVYQLNLINTVGVRYSAISAKLADDFTFNVTEALTFNSQSSFIESGAGPTGAIDGIYTDPDDRTSFVGYEPGVGTAGYINSEVGSWDDAFIDNGGADTASLNLDMHRNSWVLFNSLAGGFTDLVIAEVGALTSLELSLCPDTDCTIANWIFNGFSSSLASALASMPEFTVNEAGADPGELDQAFLFRFSDPVFDYVKITEVGDRKFYTGERLEIDFLGVGSVGSSGSDSISVVPIPAGFPLLVAGIGLLGWVSRRKRS